MFHSTYFWQQGIALPGWCSLSANFLVVTKGLVAESLFCIDSPPAKATYEQATWVVRPCPAKLRNKTLLSHAEKRTSRRSYSFDSMLLKTLRVNRAFLSPNVSRVVIVCPYVVESSSRIVIAVIFPWISTSIDFKNRSSCWTQFMYASIFSRHFISTVKNARRALSLFTIVWRWNTLQRLSYIFWRC